jgi:hypothetical protein
MDSIDSGGGRTRVQALGALGTCGKHLRDKACSFEINNNDNMNKLDGQAMPLFRYQLVVATEQFAMRGFDYRAESVGITLIIAKSFTNEREAIQGLNRVGRFGDQCKRVIIQTVDLIDREQAFTYSSTLNQFIAAQDIKRIE